MEAALCAGAHAFVHDLPEAYHTPVGPGGIVLTDSQRLRLAVARLLAQDPPAVVFEDPTAGLDAAGEAACLPGLAALARGREVRVDDASPAVRAVAEQATPPHAGRPPRPPEDSARPSLSRVLDPVAMAPLLGSLLFTSRCPTCGCSRCATSPGATSSVQYDVRTGSGWHTAVLFARAGARLHRKRKQADNRKRAHRAVGRTPARKARGYLGEVSALVQWLPLDIRLKLLADRPERIAERLNNKGIPTDPAEPELLRYWPRRRAVVKYGPHILKVYRDRLDFEDARTAPPARRPARGGARAGVRRCVHLPPDDRAGVGAGPDAVALAGVVRSGGRGPGRPARRLPPPAAQGDGQGTSWPRRRCGLISSFYSCRTCSSRLTRCWPTCG